MEVDSVSASLIAIVTVIYTAIAVSEIVGGNYPMALVYASYALANVGLVLML